MRRIVVLHGMSGVSLTRCAEKIKSSLSSLIPVEHADIEERIKSQHSFQRMTEAVWQAPRDVMTSFDWPKAAREGISQLLSSHADLGLLTCHLTYYRGQTHEFYEPGDLFQIYQDEWSRRPNNADAPAPPLCVVTLIDDLYAFSCAYRPKRRSLTFRVRSPTNIVAGKRTNGNRGTQILSTFLPSSK